MTILSELERMDEAIEKIEDPEVRSDDLRLADAVINLTRTEKEVRANVKQAMLKSRYDQ